jgi:hypothetical protein
MTKSLTPYGSIERAAGIAMVGKSKTPTSLAERMPSADVAAKVGMSNLTGIAAMRRVVRLHGKG